MASTFLRILHKFMIFSNYHFKLHIIQWAGFDKALTALKSTRQGCCVIVFEQDKNLNKTTNYHLLGEELEDDEELN